MRLGLSTLAGIFFGMGVLGPVAGSAQSWNDSASTRLVEEATARRALQLADTGLVDYSAKAKGFLTFLAQLGEGFTEPPKIVRADELALEIYWKAPNYSKQRIYARRDTLMMPTDIQYHRDHLGIIQNNFPSIIRLGDGDEVQDVPHPLSMIGLREYDFAIRDSLQIRLGPRTLNVYEVRVRPKNPLHPRAVGAVFIDVESHDVVRMAFSFTRAALKDRDLDDVSVVLENGLFEGRFWLPRRQEIEIRRSGTWLDFPARGIIRGRWEICCYQVNKGIELQSFAGAEIEIARNAHTNKEAFTGKILDSLPPDVRAVSDEDVRKVQEDARALVREQALSRTRRSGLSGRAISDFAQFNRVEGLALGGGILSRIGNGFSIPLQARYGFSDHEVKGSAALRFERANGTLVQVSGFRKYREVSEEPERSGVINSFAAQEFGSDYTDMFDSRGGSLLLRAPSISGIIPSLEIVSEKEYPLVVNARSAFGKFEPAPLADSISIVRSIVSFERPNRIGVFGLEISGRLSGEFASFQARGCCLIRNGTFGRFVVAANIEKPFGPNRVILHTYGGTVRSSEVTPAQHRFFMGGPVTAPGYNFHSLAGSSALSQRIELRFPVAFPSFSLGRYGRTPATAAFAPYFNIAGVGGTRRPPTMQETVKPGWYPSLGVGLLPMFELVRFDVARGLRNGRWTFSFDVTRDFWNVL